MVNKIIEIFNSLNIPITDSIWLESPGLPYTVYLDNRQFRGGDNKICICEHDFQIEYYSEFIDRSASDKIEEQFIENNIEFQDMPWVYIDKENLYMKKYYINSTNKI